MHTLQVLQGADRGKKFELPDHEPQLIGRSTEALPLSDNTVSRRHAELTPDDGAWYLRDLDSANGTFVNGMPIKDRVQLKPGDQIRCGSTLFLFTLTPDEDKRMPALRLLDEDALEVTVEGITDPNAESMILAAPDPIRAATDHLRVIYELTALTASTFKREDLLQRVMDLLFEEFQPDRGFMLIGDDASAPLNPAVVRYRTRPKTIDEGRIPVSRTIIRHTIEKAEGVLSTNAMNDTRFQSGDSVRDYGIRSAMCAPIAAGRRIFGVMHIDSQLANFTFTSAQLQLLNAIGQHTGLALLSIELVDSRVQTERLAAIGQTVASLSHSIKNILQGLRGGADAVELALKRGDTSLAHEGWPIVARNLDRILNLTLNMLAFTRHSGPEIELSDLHALIAEVEELVERECTRKNIGLILDLDESMPPVPFDVNGMHQVLINVVINAIEAVAKKGVVTIKTAFLEKEHAAQITVADNGPGIEAFHQAVVFEAFTSFKGQRGTGLGLAVSRKIVHQHGGTITIDSTPETGTSVLITLPCDQDVVDSGDTRLPRPIAQSDADTAF